MDEELKLFLKYQTPSVILLYLFLYMINVGFPFYVIIMYIQIMYTYSLMKAVTYEKNRYKNLVKT
jgi:hypothetical protein